MILAERESQPGYHTTGRSAALFSETYGPPQIRALSRASRAFFDGPPAGFTSDRILSPRGVLTVARSDQVEALEREYSSFPVGEKVRRVSAAEASKLMPLLRDSYVAGAIHDTSARDIDVHALHHGYLRQFRAAGGRLATDAEILGIERDAGGWRIHTRDLDIRADIVVNAAGAWADAIGAQAGAHPIGLVPKRRTALIVAAPDGAAIGQWPMVVDVDEEFYIKPDAGRFLMSPADETPSEPCDAQPEELDVAICIDRIGTAFDFPIHRVENKWAGLRSFVADSIPACPDSFGWRGRVATVSRPRRLCRVSPPPWWVARPCRATSSTRGSIRGRFLPPVSKPEGGISARIVPRRGSLRHALPLVRNRL